MSMKAVWMAVVFILALMAVPVIGQDAVSAQDEVRAEVVVIHERISTMEASQAKAKREALALQRKVAVLGKSHDGLSVRAMNLERATVSVGDRVKSLESHSVALDRRSANSEDRINNLVLDSRKTDNNIKALERRSNWALGLAIFSPLSWFVVGIIYCFARIASRREDARGSTEAPVTRHDAQLRGVSRESVVDAEIVAPREHQGEGDAETTVLSMPSFTSPTREELQAADRALDNARRPIKPISTPPQPAA